MKPVAVNQIVHVSTRNMFMLSEPGLTQEIIVKYNKSSFYTCPINDPACKYPNRYDRKSWQHDSGFGYAHKAYEKEEEYWSLIALAKEKADLKATLLHEIGDLSLVKLRSVSEHISMLRRTT